MAPEEKNASQKLIEKIKSSPDLTIGITGSPSTTLEVEIDITEEGKTERALGQMVYTIVNEDGRSVLVLGQITEVKTKNRWHEDPAFKGVIKRHGSLPHLSGAADNRLATISVQACYDLGKSSPDGYILGTSPSTGERVYKMTNEVMNLLMDEKIPNLTYMGKIYGTDVDLPFWFKHFSITNQGELGAGDAYHIGVFGKTGSGKSVTAAYMLLGYAKNKKNMNILILDPQGQFYLDQDLVPGSTLGDALKKFGVEPKKFKLLEDVYLPKDSHALFASLLQKSSFIKRSFNILSDREANAADAVALYLESRYKLSKTADANLEKLGNAEISFKLMKDTLTKFTEVEEESEIETGAKKSKGSKKGPIYNKYIDVIYTQSARKDQLIEKLQSVLANEEALKEIFEKYWQPVAIFFANVKNGGTSKTPIDDVIRLVVSEEEKGNFVILDLSGKGGREMNENIQALFVKIIESKIKEKGEEYYAERKKLNCLVVMDEAHRFISKDSEDPQIAELSLDIIDAVRTSRKCGIGYMFITQTLQSLDAQILEQMRIFAFGYGLTSGTEFRKVSDIVNNEASTKLYRSFIDPSSNKKFPFMFFGPISPLSFTGSPLFVEVYKDVSQFK